MYQYSRGHVVSDSGIQLIFIELSVISSHMFKGQGAGEGIGGFWWEPIPLLVGNTEPGGGRGDSGYYLPGI